MIHNMLENYDYFNNSIVHGMAMPVAPVTMVRCTAHAACASIAP